MVILWGTCESFRDASCMIKRLSCCFIVMDVKVCRHSPQQILYHYCARACFFAKALLCWRQRREKNEENGQVQIPAAWLFLEGSTESFPALYIACIHSRCHLLRNLLKWRFCDSLSLGRQSAFKGGILVTSSDFFKNLRGLSCIKPSVHVKGWRLTSTSNQILHFNAKTIATFFYSVWSGPTSGARISL